MHKESVIISSKQFFIISIMFLVGDGILYVPTIVATSAKEDSWIVGIISIIETLLIVWGYARLANGMKNQSLPDYLEKELGKWSAKLLLLSFIAYILVDIGLMVYEIGSFLITIILPETPIESIALALLVVISFGVKLGIETMSRASEILFPWFFGLFMLLIAFNIPNVHLENFQPFFQKGFAPIFEANIQLLPYVFEMSILIAIFPFVRNPKAATKAYVLGSTGGVLMLSIVIVVALLVFGVQTMTSEVFPSYLLGQEISIGGFFQRIEVIMAIIWFISVFFKVAFCFLIFNFLLTSVLGIEDHRLLTLPLAFAFIPLCLAFVPNTVYLVNFIVTTWLPYSVMFGMLLPFLIGGFIMLKKQLHKQ
ncbi:GerAB/ArcD/ProY family transporter [Priestia flexa]|uniref:GerAB/ArcD/ProY family transporter n=1 Tax=Priestia flexa TaxID=86664 RepID=UPI001B33FFA9|nr:endospore germination permease [Priestia flexa]